MKALLLAAASGDLGFSAPQPSSTAVPGGTVAGEFLGGVVYYGTLLTIAGFVLSAGLWAVGAFSGNYTQSVNGKRGFLVCAASALVIGGTYAITAFFYNQGASLN